MERPTSVKHFRPISCCNVIYKTISKIMCTRLALVLPDIISKNQGAFVKGRSILENILICQDLVRLYNRGMASPRCMFKLDLQKAYDIIEWKFVDQMLEDLKFPRKFKGMVMECLTTQTYTLNLNGAHFGYFQGRRRLRQGDPISPLLFCICMEYLTRIMDFAAGRWYFRYHPLSFGLRVNAAKSEVVFNGVYDGLKEDIILVSGFKEDWHDICYSKKEGGLGIKNAGVWNVASMGKLVHWLYTKADRLWVLWIDHVYLKGASWSNYQQSADSNWDWRNICKVRDLLSGGYQGNQWVLQPTGYTIRSGYCWMQGPHPHVQWYKEVWDSWNIPKHAFVGWLIQRKALNTRVKLAQIGICMSDRCLLYEGAAESHEHLFSDCVYSQMVIAGVEHWLHLKLNGRTGIYSQNHKRV
ncbi:uncharacterized protein LOC141607596 [Silene latifolia]|uniref:uncharacterized protein LOC141607596 n=1 Tax=Silene latifolia TaxID=37657 RepID=UPI003D771F39